MIVMYVFVFVDSKSYLSVTIHSQTQANTIFFLTMTNTITFQNTDIST